MYMVGKTYNSLSIMVSADFSLFESNFVQLVGSIILLQARNTELLQTSLIGGLLANLLLILGLSVLVGGVGRPTQHFNMKVAHTSANMLSLAATSLLIPTASKLLGQIDPSDIPKQSRGIAFILLIIYVCYLFFQFGTHPEVFEEKSEKVERSRLVREFTVRSEKVERQPFRTMPSTEGIGYLIQVGTAVGASTGGPSGKDKHSNESPFAPGQLKRSNNPHDDRASLNGYVALATFVISSTLLALCTDYTVNSIEALSTRANLSHTFIGLVLLPIPNCDAGPIGLASNDMLDETMNDTIGKCLQTALFVTPLTVLIAWGMGVDEMTMVFDGFEIVSLFAAILLLNLLMERGQVTW
jgi:Ca2+:H+ antiporter